MLNNLVELLNFLIKLVILVHSLITALSVKTETEISIAKKKITIYNKSNFKRITTRANIRKDAYMSYISELFLFLSLLALGSL